MLGDNTIGEPVVLRPIMLQDVGVWISHGFPSCAYIYGSLPHALSVPTCENFVLLRTFQNLTTAEFWECVID